MFKNCRRSLCLHVDGYRASLAKCIVGILLANELAIKHSGLFILQLSDLQAHGEARISLQLSSLDHKFSVLCG